MIEQEVKIWVVDSDTEQANKVMNMIDPAHLNSKNYSAEIVAPQDIESLLAKELPDLVFVSETDQPLRTIPTLQEAAQKNPNGHKLEIVLLGDKSNENLELMAYTAGASYIGRNAKPELVKSKISKELDDALGTKTLQIKSLVDGLTGLYKRDAMDRQLEFFWKEAIENKHPFSYVILDIDFFKKVNDNYGHAHGDQVLRRVGEIMRESLRKDGPGKTGDFAARYGGEELVVLLPNVDKAGAMIVAEKLNRAVFEDNIPHAYTDVNFSDGIDKRITVSVGAGTTYPNQKSDAHKFTDQVDKALYYAKSRGRDRFEFSYVPPETITRDKKPSAHTSKKPALPPGIKQDRRIAVATQGDPIAKWKFVK